MPKNVELTKESSVNVDKEYNEGSHYFLFCCNQMTNSNCHRLFAIVEHCGEYYGKEDGDNTGKLSFVQKE